MLFRSDKIWRDVLDSERAVANFSGTQIPIFLNKNDVSDREGDISVQLITERAIKDTIIKVLKNTGEGDQIDMAMFYLSERDVIDELIKAKIIAIDVKSPNKSVGKKLESMRMQKPAEIVVAV